ncbi:hypothetical protein [Haloarchaeobius iranensis]|uniref:Sulfatase n=1 Tax=Haloarchaeobius iranensis TaxID=996166 RepID=A0A1G9UN76_9EURY|nr:hypothetical protein [Haloarchaeobius iranensis]SDM60995.1 hypothetical protein SAMN05192554_104205 [Haloarchaeobius iranensis]
MRHHLRKAREIYSEKGFLQASKSALRYVPIEINNFYVRLKYGRGARVAEEDWDNLIILDGCRYDMFSDRNYLDGTLESRISLGSSSEEFLERNFDSGTYYNTVYVNGNPYIPKLGLDQGTFHAVVDCLSDWDSSLQTLPPESVVENAREAMVEFPNKRLIVHFMQPHTPFIGEVGRSIAGGGWTMDHDIKEEPGIWNQLQNGKADIPLETVWEAYNENLDLVLAEVESLLGELEGKTVITADHGNLVGERLSPIPTRRKYGHPYGVHAPELVKVPWFVVDGNERRKIQSDPPVETESISGEKVDARLKALGYR